MTNTSLCNYTNDVGYVLQIASVPARSLSVARPGAAQPQSTLLSFPPAPVKRHNLLVLWHLLSLDAPTVAVLWTAFLAHSNNLQLPAISLVAMFVAVWLLYAGDRLLDTRSANANLQQLEARHRFHAHHRRAFVAAIFVAVAVLAFVLPELSPASIRLYLIEGSFLAGYFLLLHAVRTSLRLPKEIAVGLFFAAATFIPTIARDPALRLPMLFPALLLVALCCLNCLFIYRWEHPGNPGNAHLSTILTLRYIHQIAATVFFAALLCTATQPPAARTIAGAIAASVVLLLALDLCRDRIPANTLRATADLALLTPALFLVFP